MCLIVNAKETKNYLNSFGKSGYRIAWKEFRTTGRGRYLMSPFKETRVRSGIFISDRVDKRRKRFQDRQEIGKGIHFYRKVVPLKISSVPGGMPRPHVLIPIVVHQDEILACGNWWNTVAHEVYLPQESYDWGIKNGLLEAAEIPACGLWGHTVAHEVYLPQESYDWGIENGLLEEDAKIRPNHHGRKSWIAEYAEDRKRRGKKKW